MDTDITALLSENLIGGIKGLVGGVLIGSILYEPPSYDRMPSTFFHRLGIGAALSYGADLAALTGLNIGGPTNWENNPGTALGFVLGYYLADKTRDFISIRDLD